nr:nuclear transport factor 2 family protein [uncultured Roseococcus sp.]
MALMLFGDAPEPWFEEWLERVVGAITRHDITLLHGAFAPEARYFLKPHAPPLEGPEAILRHVAAQFGGQRELSCTTEILGFTPGAALMRWKADYVLTASDAREAYDGLVIYRFDAQRRCLLRQSWAVQWTPALP